MDQIAQHLAKVRQHLAGSANPIALIVTRRAKTMGKYAVCIFIGLVEPPIEGGTSEEVREIKHGCPKGATCQGHQKFHSLTELIFLR